MKGFLFLILFIAIVCQPSLLISKEERIARQKEMKELFIKCLKEKASKEFVEAMNQNIPNLRMYIMQNKGTISIEDKKAIRYLQQMYKRFKKCRNFLSCFRGEYYSGK